MLGIIAMYNISVFGLLVGIVVMGLIGCTAILVILAIARSENITQLLKALILGGLGLLALFAVVAVFLLRVNSEPRQSRPPQEAGIKSPVIEYARYESRMTADTDVRTLPAPGSTMERIAEASENETGGQEPREAAAPDTSSADEPTLREVTKPADLPDWIQQDHYVGEVHYVSVSSFPKVETDEARADAWRLAQEEIVEDFHANYPDAADWEPPVDLVSRESVVVDEFRETRDMNITGNFSSPMQIVHYRVKLTPETREIVHNAYREQVARARLEQVGVGVGILTVLTGGLALLLRRPHRHQAKAT